MQTEDIKPRILYVDDEEENLLVFKSSFRRNYSIITAHSAAEAIDLLKEQTVDIIISDQRMPGMTGVEFLKSLPDEPDNLRMLLTGFSDMQAVIEAFNTSKIYRYLTKPWEKTELQPVIDGAFATLKELRDKKQLLQHLEQEKKTLEESLTGNDQKTNESTLRLDLINKDEEMQQLKKQVEEAYRNVQLLNEIGQEIISNRTIESIIESTYENVNALMDATCFGIGIYNAENRSIDLPGFIEKGEKLPAASVSLDEDRPAIWTFKSNKEFFSNDFINDFSKLSTAKTSAVKGDVPESMIYLPLQDKEKVIGVITVQSFKKGVYSFYHLNILKNIAIYVATALENAKAYHLIEEQKTEIEHKNIELEHKVQQRTEELQQKNDELESTYRKVKLLSEIGQQITSTLSLETIIERVYENVNSLMDATIFSIGVYNSEERSIEFRGAIEKGEKLPAFSYSLDDDRPAILCFKNEKEIIINDYQREFNKYVKSIANPVAGETPESLVYLPLISNNGSIGTISVQSFKKHIYNQYHIDILRSLASYATIAIQNANSYHKMTEAFEELKKAQTKLVESEKMASLGVLTAGVAHEINNPVNFISAGITSLKQNYKEVEELLKAYLSYNPETSDPAVWERIMEMKLQITPDELLPEIEDLFTSIRNGATRTSEIVKGLRNFSRLDENEMKKTRIEDGIDNTLVILNNRMKNRIHVVKEYGEIPEIICYPGQLNQVFMNLLHNASDAIEGAGTIHIKTVKLNDHIVLSIRDSGKGISEEVRSRIFEPFFTTKAIGKGTGLGLSIAYGIIEKHKGSIEVESEEGKGTQFTIRLPIQN